MALIGIACASGAMLFVATLKTRSGGSALTTLAATQMINHKNAVIVDVRDAAEYSSGTLVGARHIPLDTLAARVGEINRFKGRPVILVCASGNRSGRAVDVLVKAGFSEVYNLAGGVSSWGAAGLPLVKSGAEQSSSARKEKA